MGQTFNNLRLKDICELLDILESTNIESRSQVERIFRERAEGFAEVLAFLARLDVIAVDDRSIQLKCNWSASQSEPRREVILQWLLIKRNRYTSDILRFLERFEVSNGDISYISPDQKRSAESSVRNFLIDLGVIRYEMFEDRYVLDPQYISIYTNARDGRRLVSPALLNNRLTDQNELGFAAEKVIIDYERSRVGKMHEDKIDHVAKRNSAAGYDIRSITHQGCGQILPRFIEVKVVSPSSCRFYWSRNEVEVASELADWYYLYLLPITGRGQFDIQMLKIIQNPVKMVMGEGSNWVTESDAIICYHRITEQDH